MLTRIAIVSPAPIKHNNFNEFEKIWLEKATIKYFSFLNDTLPTTASLYKPDPDEPVLMLGLSEGRSNPIGILKIVEGIKNLISEVSKNADIIFFACAGDFQKLEADIPIVQPALVLRDAICKVIQNGQKLGIITPGKAQIGHVSASWKKHLQQAGKADVRLHVEACEPNMQEIETCITRFSQDDLIAVECLGFKSEMGEIIENTIGKPVLLARDVAGKMVTNLLGF